MEDVILEESLVYYAARNSITGKYKSNVVGALPTYDKSKIKLYKSKTTAEKYGSRYGCDEVVKMKLIRIE